MDKMSCGPLHSLVGRICIDQTSYGYFFSIDVDGREVYCDGYEYASLRYCHKKAVSFAARRWPNVSFLCDDYPPNVKDHRTVIIAFLRAGTGAKLHLSRGPMHPLVGQSKFIMYLIVITVKD